MRTRIKELFGNTSEYASKEVTVCAWVRTNRAQAQFGFLNVNDGSFFENLQVVYEQGLSNFEDISKIRVGSSVQVTGTVVLTPEHQQPFEVKATAVTLLGDCPENYPIQPKRHTREFLRTVAHLRPRTNLFSAVFRIRSVAAMAVHTYFQDRGYVYVHTPLITGADCEGSDQMFKITTLNMNDLPKTDDGKVDFSKDLFGKQSFITGSGQLQGETFAMAFGDIYTFGPTFRTENSNTQTHANEFWMIEPEMAFLDQQGLMDLEEDFIKYCVRWALEHCKDDLEFLNKMIDKTLIARLEGVLKEEFVRLPYTEGINILQEAIKKGKKFEFTCNWGDDLASEHERYLVEEHFKKPVIMTDYPTAIKAFYMKQNTPTENNGSMGYNGAAAPGPTMQGTDVLFPQIGEIIGGSVREESYDKLMAEIDRRGMETDKLWWYLDTRRWGTCPHAGFGLGFERLILFVTGMQNIRDVIPFPRTPKSAEF